MYKFKFTHIMGAILSSLIIAGCQPSQTNTNHILNYRNTEVYRAGVADDVGNVYVTGAYFVETGVKNRKTSIVITKKYDSSDNLIWEKRIPDVTPEYLEKMSDYPSDYTRGVALYRDSEGNIYNTVNIQDPLSYGKKPVSTYKIIKYSPQGNIIWEKSGNGRYPRIYIDNEDNLYLTADETSQEGSLLTHRLSFYDKDGNILRNSITFDELGYDRTASYKRYKNKLYLTSHVNAGGRPLNTGEGGATSPIICHTKSHELNLDNNEFVTLKFEKACEFDETFVVSDGELSHYQIFSDGTKIKHSVPLGNTLAEPTKTTISSPDESITGYKAKLIGNNFIAFATYSLPETNSKQYKLIRTTTNGEVIQTVPFNLSDEERSLFRPDTMVFSQATTGDFVLESLNGFSTSGNFYDSTSLYFFDKDTLERKNKKIFNRSRVSFVGGFPSPVNGHSYFAVGGLYEGSNLAKGLLERF